VLKHVLQGAGIAVAVGVALPEIEVTYACLRPYSEGCVWGHALILVNMVATFVLIGIPVAAASRLVAVAKVRADLDGTQHVGPETAITRFLR
jgi:hypothetical protein